MNGVKSNEEIITESKIEYMRSRDVSIQTRLQVIGFLLAFLALWLDRSMDAGSSWVTLIGFASMFCAGCALVTTLNLLDITVSLRRKEYSFTESQFGNVLAKMNAQELMDLKSRLLPGLENFEKAVANGLAIPDMDIKRQLPSYLTFYSFQKLENDKLPRWERFADLTNLDFASSIFLKSGIVLFVISVWVALCNI